MEVIHLILGKANPNRMNGVNKVVHQLASKQVEFGHQVSVWGITKDLVHNYPKRNFETLLFHAGRNPFAINRALKNKIIDKKNKVIFHLHGGWIPIYYSLSILMNKHSIPFVLTPHGAYNKIAMQRSRWIKKVYFKICERKVLKYAYKIHLIGESEILGLNKMYENSNTVLIPYGFEAPQSKVKNVKDVNKFVIGFVGRLDIYTKGLDLLIKGFLEFYKDHQFSKLWIIGDSEERSTLKDLIDKNELTSAVVLWGKQFGEDKIKLLHQMDVFVHSSRNEGLPASVLEACNLGLPVVVTKATNMGTNVLKSNAGVVVNNEDQWALTQAFSKLYEKKEKGELLQLSKNAQEMVAKKYNWNKVLKEFDQLYERK